MSQQCPCFVFANVVAVFANGFLGYTRMSTASRMREVILSLCSAPVRHIWSAVSSSGLLQYKRDMKLMEQFQQKAMKMMKGLEHPVRKGLELKDIEVLERAQGRAVELGKGLEHMMDEEELREGKLLREHKNPLLIPELLQVPLVPGGRNPLQGDFNQEEEVLVLRGCFPTSRQAAAPSGMPVPRK
ncbi:hypothetical protein HGM15179_003790 [Zosterops borbonicus]|uniref:Uncharacterized protein n=1 Tax=Zosterops borbonicus TaxID=364589 RepID=A0A8K1GQ98_9PASS|nr:hypothetical protein HGM15179_003790 [Zosterops borbonicus]